MLHQERIPIGKLKQAYDLNEQEADILITVLARQRCIDLYESWREAEYFFVAKENPNDATDKEARKPYFPDVLDLGGDILQERIATKRMLRFFLFRARAKTPREHLQKRFNRILQFTYDAADKAYIDLVAQILDLIYEQCIIGYRCRDKVDIAWEYVSPELFTKFCSFFDDAISVDKAAAVRYLYESGYPLKREVKGLSYAIVERITATTASHPQVEHITAPHAVHPPEDTPVAPAASSIAVSSDLWEGKSSEAICKAMSDDGFDKPIIAYVLYAWRKKSKTEIGRLLGPRGENEHDSASRRRTNELLKEAAAFTITSA